MIVWGGVVGALIGWSLADFESFGLYLGMLAGVIFGWGLRRSVRAEIANAAQMLRGQLDEALAPDPIAQGPTGLIPKVSPPSPVGRAMPKPVSPWPAFPQVEPTPESTAKRESTPTEPGIVEAMIAAGVETARTWLFGGNTIVRVGLIILFVGLSFLASYAASAGLFPIEFRLALVVAIGIALLAVGFKTRTTRPGFGLALQGGGIAVIYLTLFAAAKLYDTFPVLAAFILMVVVCGLGCALALLQRSQPLAATAFTGGFAVPLLLAGGGDIVVVFAYYAILNLAVLFIAQRQAWRALNLIGFFATFGAAALWAMTRYQPGDFIAAQSFLILSVLIYVMTAVLYAQRTSGRLGSVVDTTLLFGPAMVGFGLEVGLVHHRPFGTAFAALGFAALYLAVASWTMRYRRTSFRIMNETLLAIGIGFVTLAVPLALGARWTSAAWALEGAGAFWVGVRQARWMPRLFGILLQLLAALIVMSVWDNVSALPLANPNFVGAMLVALAGLATAWSLRAALLHSGSRIARFYARIEADLAGPAFLFGFAFWCAAWTGEAVRVLPPRYAGLAPTPVFDSGLQPLLVGLVFVASAWIAQAMSRRWRWPVAGWPSYTTLPALALAFAGTTALGRHVLDTPDWALWIAAIGVHLRLLHANDKSIPAVGTGPLLKGVHVGGVWLAVAILADCLWLGIARGDLWGTAWAEVSGLIAAVAVLTALTAWAGRALRTPDAAMRWPLNSHAAAYAWYAAIPVAALTYAGALMTALLSSGATAPLPYLPLLNPVDLTLALSLGGLELWRRTLLAAKSIPGGAAALGSRWTTAALAGLAFVMVNTAWLRFAHHKLGVRWETEDLLASVIVQTGLAILWTSLALALMVLACQRGRRTLWLTGAGLLALTVVKLLLVDLGNAGGGARIIAFIVVGLLMLVVGYLAPIPPKVAVPGERINAA